MPVSTSPVKVIEGLPTEPDAKTPVVALKELATSESALMVSPVIVAPEITEVKTPLTPVIVPA
jgi:hypothetical protein